MSRITNTILFPSTPNPQYKKYLNGRLTLTLIIPSHPSRCESWNDYRICIPCLSKNIHEYSLCFAKGLRPIGIQNVQLILL